MDREKTSDKTEVILYENKPVTESNREMHEQEEEKIRVFEPPKKQNKHNRGDYKTHIWRFVAITFVFVSVYLCLFLYFGGLDKFQFRAVRGDGAESEENIPAAALPSDDTSETEENAQEREAKSPPLIIDESMTGIDISEEMNGDYSLGALLGSTDGVKVVILHSHNSEFVSDSISVSDAGEALAQILTSAGITTYHSTKIHDAEGNIGSYKRMNETLTEIIQKYPDVVCVIDIHDSDSGLPLTFTFGTGSQYGWRENLRLASAIYSKMYDIEGAFRFLPGDLGQNSGMLTVNVGIGGVEYDDETARKAISEFAEAFMKICNEKASVGN